MSDLVSVIVPVYNVRDYLDTCVESLVAQTYENLEILLVDDGSTDESGQICERWAQKDSRISVIHQKNEGLGGARNSGLDSAHGEYVYFIDGDDWLKPETFSEIIKYMQTENLGICFFAAQICKENDAMVWNGSTYTRSSDYGCHSGKTILAKLIDRDEYTPSACMYVTRRHLIIESGLRFSRGYFEDQLFTFSLCMQAKRAGVMSQRYYMRRVRPDSIMTKLGEDNKRIASYEKVVEGFDSMECGKSMTRYRKKMVYANARALLLVASGDRANWRLVLRYLRRHRFFGSEKLVMRTGYQMLKRMLSTA